MSPIAHIPSHRKPRRAASSTRALRAGVTGGILTLAVAGTSVQANATETAAESTLEMPTVSDALATTAAQTAAATEEAAFGYELQAQQDDAADKARSAAKKAHAEAVRKAKAAEAKRKAAERRAEKAAQERASRSAERTSLSAPSTGSPSVPSSSSATGSVATLLSFLQGQVGKAYVSGATGPSAYDCSGLTMTAFKQIGITLPRVSQDQSTVGTQVSLNALQPGDILYWGSSGSAWHVAVYIGDGKFIGAQNPSSGVVVRDMSYDMPTGAVRVL
ncbi:C40 family peptidase [Streptomyces sp. XD-27]|uniref:C40 family peptidase n=1 Tax=Streptomyces sp. XD-27 TaxID=3062779 RepID=UPI0026F45FC3|nr:C40 family peptidase [Streptomyces sp. XD-27]WKX71931.1 NlpC/P60 family protein [Streptomyces sp. XD-27]